ncbi:hypothetical protein [Mesorhizobium sp. Root102]|uniref:hypothetical protein n=1 Tax=Mesorhizobium sp. Root102 TaxID=1736422 RepID=UPI0012E3B95A|nr:hypothetical protein [Mesorhizobium sp. Root102]
MSSTDRRWRVSPETIEALSKEADDVICLEEPEFFQTIGLYYRDFRQLRDQDVIALMDAAQARVVAGTPPRSTNSGSAISLTVAWTAPMIEISAGSSRRFP